MYVKMIFRYCIILLYLFTYIINLVETIFLKYFYLLTYPGNFTRTIEQLFYGLNTKISDISLKIPDINILNSYIA